MALRRETRCRRDFNVLGIAHTAAVQAGHGQTGRVDHHFGTWIAGIVLTLSPFMDWYVATLPNGLTYSVTGWHTGVLGKLVFFIGLVILIIEALHEAGIELPPAV